MLKQRKARELAANDVTVLLNAALVYELAAKRGQALAALKKYFALSGPQQAIEQEPLFAELRNDPGYVVLLASKKAAKSKTNK